MTKSASSLMYTCILTMTMLLAACDRNEPGKSTATSRSQPEQPLAGDAAPAGSQAESKAEPKPQPEAQQKYPPATVDMTLQQVSPHVYYVQGAAGTATENQGFISNAGVILTSDGVVVFDTLGTPSLGQMLLEKIRAITDMPIRKVVMSHYHADHIYGLQVFKDLGAEIIAPKGSYEYLDSPLAMERLEERRFSLDPWVNDQTRLVKPDVIVDGESRFSLGGIDFLINVLGKAHSDGDMTLYVENDRVLLSGDIIFEGRVPYLGDADTKQWLETLKRIETKELVALIPGHGPAASNPNEALQATRKYLAFMRNAMGQAVEDFVSFDEAYKNTDWSEFEKLPAFEAANRRNAYQVFLSIEQEFLSGKH